MANVTNEELEEINKLRVDLSNLVAEAGQTSLQIQLLEEDIVTLKKKSSEYAKGFKSLLEKEQELIDRLSKKYGAGKINFETGEYIPEN